MILTIAGEDFDVQYVESLAGVELEDDKFFTFGGTANEKWI